MPVYFLYCLLYVFTCVWIRYISECPGFPPLPAILLFSAVVFFVRPTRPAFVKITREPSVSTVFFGYNVRYCYFSNFRRKESANYFGSGQLSGLQLYSQFNVVGSSSCIQLYSVIIQCIQLSKINHAILLAALFQTWPEGLLYL